VVVTVKTVAAVELYVLVIVVLVVSYTNAGWPMDPYLSLAVSAAGSRGGVITTVPWVS